MAQVIWKPASIFLVLQLVMQNMIDFACYSWIPQENFHAALNFVHEKKCSHKIIHIWKFSWFVGTVIQDELSFPE
jgi:hypothetical protein